MKNIFILSFALLIMFMSGACKKDEEFCDDPTDETCPNFDICTQAVAANSDFRILGRISSARIADTIVDIEIDTAYGSGNTYYKAEISEGLASYAWKVGADSRVFPETEINLNFSGYVGDVSITLETTATNTGGCLEESQLLDTRTKQMHYADRGRVGSIYGIFKGEVLGETNGQEYEVVVDNSLPPFRRLRGLPLPDDCTLNGRGVPVYFAYQFFLSAFVQERLTPRCRNLTVIGRINLEDSNELRIDYVYDDDDGKRKEVVFIGRRQ